MHAVMDTLGRTISLGSLWLTTQVNKITFFQGGSIAKLKSLLQHILQEFARYLYLHYPRRFRAYFL